MKKRISLLGCGWFGFSLGKVLIKDGYQVKGSTTSREKLVALERAGIFPFLMHLDPEPGPVFSVDSFFQTEILIISIPQRNNYQQEDYHKRQLLYLRDQIIKHNIKKVVFISSTGVYPNLNRIVSEEDADPESLNRGGISVLEMERIFTSSFTFETTVVRFGGLYGNDRHPGRFLAGKQHVPGAENPVNMIHLDDCVGVVKAILDQEIWGETFNACSPNHPSRRKFYTKAAFELGVHPPSFSDHEADFKVVSSQRLCDRLGYSFKY